MPLAAFEPAGGLDPIAGACVRRRKVHRCVVNELMRQRPCGTGGDIETATRSSRSMDSCSRAHQPYRGRGRRRQHWGPRPQATSKTQTRAQVPMRVPAHGKARYDHHCVHAQPLATGTPLLACPHTHSGAGLMTCQGRQHIALPLAFVAASAGGQPLHLNGVDTCARRQPPPFAPSRVPTPWKVISSAPPRPHSRFQPLAKHPAALPLPPSIRQRHGASVTRPHGARRRCAPRAAYWPTARV